MDIKYWIITGMEVMEKGPELKWKESETLMAMRLESEW
jgi:hypothetical protein